MTTNRDIIFELSDHIWDLAEVKFETQQSCDLFVDILDKKSFNVERPYCGINHAFKATWGDKGPRIGLLVEYDALDGKSQIEDVYYEAKKEGMTSGHACGHNLLGSAVLLAALDLKDKIQEENIDAQIVVFGCPAEESGYGKSIMAKHNAFSDLDIALTWHPHYLNALWQDQTLAVRCLTFNYKGISAHAASAPHLGRSALDACELMNIGVNYLREHVMDDVRIHYAYLNAGGSSANAVQADTSLYYFIRAFDQDILDQTVERVVKIAHGAALMSETTLDYYEDASCAALLPNEVLSKTVYQHLKNLEPLEYSDSALDFIKGYNPKTDQLTKVAPYSIDQKSYASTDVGNVSQQVPTCQFFLACEPFDCPMHSWQWVANGKSDFAHEGIVKAASVLTKTALSCIYDPQIIADARKEFNLRKDKQYVKKL